MSYWLVLSLPFDVTLVYKTEYTDKEAALEGAVNLPEGFVPMDESDIDFSAVIKVPFKEKPCEQKTSEDTKKPENNPSSPETSSILPSSTLEPQL